MFAILLALLIFGMLFHEITYPIAMFLSEHKFPFLLVFLICFVGYAIAYGKKRKSVVHGVGVFFAYSQFWFFILMGVLGISESIATEPDPVMSAIIAILTGALVGGYGLFNYKMLSAAREEAESKPWLFLIVGIVGWAVILFIG